MAQVPACRVRVVNDAAVREGGDYVLYWMIGQRRTRWSFALDEATRRAQALRLPLLIFEPLRVGYRWASDRFHRFVIEGMADNADACAKAGVSYFPYVEPEEGAGKGLLEALASRAAAVITDDVPGFFQPRMVEVAGKKLDVALVAVDGCGLLPLADSPKAFTTAAVFRRYLHKSVRAGWPSLPTAQPLDAAPGGAIDLSAAHERWPPADLDSLLADEGLAELPIDHEVKPVPYRGGAKAAAETFSRFLDEKIRGYADERNHPDHNNQSGLSPWLHFGHISAQEMVMTVLERDGWTPAELRPENLGRREGFWGASPEVESFLDELITWREVGYTFCHHRPDFDRYDSLPEWAKKSLAEHATDERPELYTLEQLDRAETEDRVWNAAQRQLVEEGRIHNYLRMLWGKKVLQWSPSPQEAVRRLIELNNRYAVDGRDPNSYSGIFWCFGRFDRAWGPERPIFGKVRYMTSDSAQRKLKMKRYLEHWGATDEDGKPRQLALA